MSDVNCSHLKARGCRHQLTGLSVDSSLSGQWAGLLPAVPSQPQRGFPGDWFHHPTQDSPVLLTLEVSHDPFLYDLLLTHHALVY